MTTLENADRRAREAHAALVQLQQALKTLETAEKTAAIWTDDVRQDVEHRLGTTYVSNDPRVLSDPEYVSALDWYSRISEAVLATRVAYNTPVYDLDGDER